MTGPNHTLHINDYGQAHPSAYVAGGEQMTLRDWYTGVALPGYRGYALLGSTYDGTLFDIVTDRTTGARAWIVVSVNGLQTPT